MNNGGYWTEQEQKDLLSAYKNKSSGQSDNAFCSEWAQSHDMSTEAVRNKLRALKRGEPIKEKVYTEPKEESSYEQGDDFINIVCASKRMRSKEDVLKEFNIDLSVWEVDKYKVKTSEGYRKDRSVEWHVKNGNVTQGDVSDSGKMLVVPLYHIEVRLVRRLAPSPEAILADFNKLQNVYKIPEFKYSDLNLRNNMLEISLADLHIGKLAWGKESGEDYDSKIARKRFIDAINDILSRTTCEKFQKIILPIGNDLLNSDTPSGTTTKGTQLTNDSRWQKLYYDVVHILIQGIDLLTSVAPVEAFWIPGNHDTMSSFYVASYLSAWYKKSKNVNIDVSPTPRKYIEFGKCLIGFSHGAEDSKRIPQLMQVEAREAWGRTLYHEYHLGNLHHETVTENGGLIIRRMSSLTSNDDWHTDKGYVGSIHKAQAFTWNKERGLLGIINSPVI
jgi:hypothetical protein